jgi:hypothetical protein
MFASVSTSKASSPLPPLDRAPLRRMAGRMCILRPSTEWMSLLESAATVRRLG